MTTFTVSLRRRLHWPTFLTTLLFLLAGSQCYAQPLPLPSPFNSQSWGQELVFYPFDSVEFAHWPTRFGYRSGGEGDTVMGVPDRPVGGATVWSYTQANTPAGTVVFSGMKCPNGDCPSLQGTTLYLVITGLLREYITMNPDIADTTRLLKLVVDDSSAMPITSQTFYVRKRDAMGNLGLPWNAFKEMSYPIRVTQSGRNRLGVRGEWLGVDEGLSIYSVRLRDSLAQLVLGSEEWCIHWRRNYLATIVPAVRHRWFAEQQQEHQQQLQIALQQQPSTYASLQRLQKIVEDSLRSEPRGVEGQ